jgi:hypothetical protein
VAQILAIDPTYGDRAIDDLKMRNLLPDYIPLIVDGLTKAGLVIATNPKDGS